METRPPLGMNSTLRIGWACLALALGMTLLGMTVCHLPLYLAAFVLGVNGAGKPHNRWAFALIAASVLVPMMGLALTFGGE